VGIGSQKKRAYSTYKRSKFWHSIIEKTDYEVVLIKENVSVEEAYQMEKDLIKFYGRRDLGLGALVNMTDGGDGRFGAIASEETRRKMSQSQKGLNTWTKGHKTTNETKEKISNILKEYWKHNTKAPLTEEAKEKIRQSLTGRPGTWIGKKHSEESLQKMRDSHGKGKNNKRYGQKNSADTIKKMSESAKNRERAECPHCRKVGEKNAMMRWHFDKCKNKNQ
jgi:hypothetical protein